MQKKDTLMCVACGSVALVAGVVCHRVAPGLGLVLMPMFWPLAFLATRVSLVKASATAAIVPFVSALLTGMPAMPFVVSVKFALFTAAACFVWRQLARLRSR